MLLSGQGKSAKIKKIKSSFVQKFSLKNKDKKNLGKAGNRLGIAGNRLFMTSPINFEFNFVHKCLAY